MPLRWFGTSRPESVTALVARRKYEKALEVLRQELQTRKNDARLRLQLADVLVKAGKAREAVPIFIALADEFAMAGAPGKAISMLKRIETLDPGRPDVAERLAFVLKAKDPEARAARVASARAAASAPSVSSAAPAGAAGGGFPGDIGDMEEIDEAASMDLAIDAIGDLESELGPGEGRAAETAGGGGAAAAGDASASGSASASGTQVPLASEDERAFFDGFSQAELLAIMQGLNLVRLEAGDIAVTEGEPGTSLFVITSGGVKAWVKNAAGANRMVRTMGEGEFFGEIALLQGRPRTATVTAAAPTELLELDRKALASVAETQPNIMKVLEEFAARRSGSMPEAAIRSSGAPPEA